MRKVAPPIVALLATINQARGDGPATQAPDPDGCPAPFLLYEGKYLTSEEPHGVPDPDFYPHAGVYGTHQAPGDFKGAEELCISDPKRLCKALAFTPNGGGRNGQPDISQGVFFYGNQNMYTDPSGKSVAYILNPDFVSKGCLPKGWSNGGNPGSRGRPTNGTAGLGDTTTTLFTPGFYFLVAFGGSAIVYLAAGIAFNYKRRELRGAQAIPNVEFWKDLPCLVRDGMVFSARTVFRRRGGGADEEYTTV